MYAIHPSLSFSPPPPPPSLFNHLTRPNEQEFALPPSRYSFHRLPKNGDIVSIAFEDQSRRDAPTNARAVRIREDLTWDAVLRSHVSEQKFNGMNGVM